MNCRDNPLRYTLDFVICQGVLAYLSPPDLKRALRNLGALSKGALYMDVVAREDYERDMVDEDLTDPHPSARWRKSCCEQSIGADNQTARR